VRDKEASEMLISLVIVPVDHCVALAGVPCVVFGIRVTVISAEIDGVRPGRGASFKRPSMPCSRKRSRHDVTMRGATLSVAAICLFCSPSAASNTMRLRITARVAVDRPRACRSSFRRISASRTIGQATRISRSPHHIDPAPRHCYAAAYRMSSCPK